MCCEFIDVSEILNFIRDIAWPLVVISIFIIFRREVKQLLEAIASGKLRIQYKGVSLGPPHEVEEELRKKLKELENQIKLRPLTGLGQILLKYKYVYGEWEQDNEHCHVVRFSDAYYGPVLRYIDDLSQELDLYLRNNKNHLKDPLLQSVIEFKNYVDEIKRYQKKTQELSEPRFSMPKYLKLWHNVYSNLQKENILE